MKSEHKKTLKNRKSVQGVSKQTTQIGHGKTHQNYWKARLYRNTYTRDGQRFEVPEWYVKIQHLGRRETFNLAGANKTAAAMKARDIYLSLHASGWEPTLRKYKPDTAIKIDLPTVGEFLNEVKAKADLKPKTLAYYTRMFRKIIADINGLEDDRSKYDYKSGGYQKWLKKIEAVKMNSLTPEKIQKWKISFIAKAGNNPIKRKEARNSANTFIRNAKCLFAPDVLKFIKGLELPSPLPFEGIKVETLGSTRYKSEINLQRLLASAKNELAVSIPEIDDKNPKENRQAHQEALLKNELYKIFLLAIGAGLRRNEIDKLEWASIFWDDSKIRIQATKYFQPKTEESEGDIDVDPELLEVLRFYLPSAKDEFVINGNRPRLGASYENYRCAKEYDALVKWLRSKGITAKSPMHSLRKEFGSLICEQGGIFAASVQLRHSNIGITRDHYIDKKERVTVKIGKMLKEPSIKAVAS